MGDGGSFRPGAFDIGFELHKVGHARALTPTPKGLRCAASPEFSPLKEKATEGDPQTASRWWARVAV